MFITGWLWSLDDSPFQQGNTLWTMNWHHMQWNFIFLTAPIPLQHNVAIFVQQYHCEYYTYNAVNILCRACFPLCCYVLWTCMHEAGLSNGFCPFVCHLSAVICLSRERNRMYRVKQLLNPTGIWSSIASNAFLFSACPALPMFNKTCKHAWIEMHWLLFNSVFLVFLGGDSYATVSNCLTLYLRFTAVNLLSCVGCVIVDAFQHICTPSQTSPTPSHPHTLSHPHSCTPSHSHSHTPSHPHTFTHAEVVWEHLDDDVLTEADRCFNLLKVGWLVWF